MTTSQQSEACSPTALVYETTEEAIVLLRTAADDDVAQAHAAAAEAAYYLSDTIEPDDRTSLLARAQRRRRGAGSADSSAARVDEALALLGDAAGEVEEMLHGPSASSELRIALGALRRAIRTLASDVGRATSHLGIDGSRGQHPRVLRRLNPRQR